MYIGGKTIQNSVIIKYYLRLSAPLVLFETDRVLQMPDFLIDLYIYSIILYSLRPLFNILLLISWSLVLFGLRSQDLHVFQYLLLVCSLTLSSTTYLRMFDFYCLLIFSLIIFINNDYAIFKYAVFIPIAFYGDIYFFDFQITANITAWHKILNK